MENYMFLTYRIIPVFFAISIFMALPTLASQKDTDQSKDTASKSANSVANTDTAAAAPTNSSEVDEQVDRSQQSKEWLEIYDSLYQGTLTAQKLEEIKKTLGDEKFRTVMQETDQFGYTLIIHAMHIDNYELMQKMVPYSNVNHISKQNNTLFTLAITYKSMNQIRQVWNSIKNHADVNQLIPLDNNTFCTPMSWAIQRNAPEIVRFLIYECHATETNILYAQLAQEHYDNILSKTTFDTAVMTAAEIEKERAKIKSDNLEIRSLLNKSEINASTPMKTTTATMAIPTASSATALATSPTAITIKAGESTTHIPISASNPITQIIVENVTPEEDAIHKHFMKLSCEMREALQEVCNQNPNGIVEHDTKGIVVQLQKIKIEKGTDYYKKLINFQHTRYNSLLYQAIRGHNIPVIRELANDLDFNAADIHGICPLHDAIYTGQLKIVQAVILGGANPNKIVAEISQQTGESYTKNFIYESIIQNEPSITKYLLENCNVELLTASINNLFEARIALSRILQIKNITAQNNAQIKIETENNKNIIDLIEKHQNLQIQIARKMQIKGPHIPNMLDLYNQIAEKIRGNAPDALQFFQKIRDELTAMDFKELITMTNPQGQTLLIFACRYLNLNMTRELIKAGSDVNKIFYAFQKGSNNQYTPLSLIIGQYDIENRDTTIFEIIKELIQGKAKAGLILTMLDFPTTPLLWALEFNDPELIEPLLHDMNIDSFSIDKDKVQNTYNTFKKKRINKDTSAATLQLIHQNHQKIVKLIEEYPEKQKKFKAIEKEVLIRRLEREKGTVKQIALEINQIKEQLHKQKNETTTKSEDNSDDSHLTRTDLAIKEIGKIARQYEVTNIILANQLQNIENEAEIKSIKEKLTSIASIIQAQAEQEKAVQDKILAEKKKKEEEELALQKKQQDEEKKKKKEEEERKAAEIALQNKIAAEKKKNEEDEQSKIYEEKIKEEQAKRSKQVRTVTSEQQKSKKTTQASTKIKTSKTPNDIKPKQSVVVPNDNTATHISVGKTKKPKKDDKKNTVTQEQSQLKATQLARQETEKTEQQLKAHRLQKERKAKGKEQNNKGTRSPQTVLSQQPAPAKKSAQQTAPIIVELSHQQPAQTPCTTNEKPSDVLKTSEQTKKTESDKVKSTPAPSEPNTALVSASSEINNPDNQSLNSVNLDELTARITSGFRPIAQSNEKRKSPPLKANPIIKDSIAIPVSDEIQRPIVDSSSSIIYHSTSQSAAQPTTTAAQTYPQTNRSMQPAAFLPAPATAHEERLRQQNQMLYNPHNNQPHFHTPQMTNHGYSHPNSAAASASMMQNRLHPTPAMRLPMQTMTYQNPHMHQQHAHVPMNYNTGFAMNSSTFTQTSNTTQRIRYVPTKNSTPYAATEQLYK